MRSRDFNSLLLVLLATLMWCTLCVGENDEKEDTRRAKQFSVFEIIRFDNNACTGNNNLNGTCYTADECTQRSGSAMGNCADGFGVCCVFSVTCGGMSNENCTYFTNPTTVTSGACKVHICPTDDNICQLRLDFTNFNIAGPSADSSVVGLEQFGQLVPSATGGIPTTLQGRCLTDTFSVTNTRRPQICGTNTGQHMYVDASADCNDLVFQLGEDPNGITTIPTRTWNIKVTQLSCEDKNLPPEGCTQYFSNINGMGQFETFNFDGGQHLANQDQTICVRQEMGQCRICYTATAATDFQVSGGMTPSSTALTPSGANLNCGLFVNPDGVGVTSGFFDGLDFVSIRGAEKVTANAGSAVPSRICGANSGLVTASGGGAKVVCSTDTPFIFRFVSDAFETLPEARFQDKGARIDFTQDAVNCN